MARSALFLILAATLGIPAHAGESGYAPRAIDLLDRPAGSPVTRLAKQQPVEILARSGSWANVSTGNTDGWLRLIDVRLNAASPSKVTAAVRVKSTTDSGIRGFSEEDLLTGTPGHGEIDKLKRYSVAAKDATGFARSAGLKSRKQDYIEPTDYLSMEELPDDFFDE